MTGTSPPVAPEPPADEALPSVRTLLGDGAFDVLTASTLLDGTAADIAQARPWAVTYRPGRSITVTYRIPSRDQDGSPSYEFVVARAGAAIPPHVLTLEGEGETIGLWRYPDDPAVPGLRSALDADMVTDILAQVGVHDGTPRLTARSYRAGRRAVVEATTLSHRIFLKVVRPSEVAALQETHVTLARHLPVPHSLGWNEPLGIVVFEALPGRPLRKLLESPDGSWFPGARDLQKLLDRLVHAPAGPKRSGPVERASGYGRLIRTVVPEQAGAVDEVLEMIESAPPGEPVTTHGDFHSSQIIVNGDEIGGIVDVDTVGIGARSDDIGTLLAHLHGVGLDAGRKSHITQYGRALIAEFDKTCDPLATRTKAAAAMLGFATGPFRTQHPEWPSLTRARVDAARGWATSSSALGEG